MIRTTQEYLTIYKVLEVDNDAYILIHPTESKKFGFKNPTLKICSIRKFIERKTLLILDIGGDF